VRDAGWIEVVGRRFDVYKDRRRAHVASACSARGEGQRRRRHAIAGPHASDCHGRVQSGGPARKRHRMFCFDGLSKGVLELLDMRTLSQPVAAEYVDNGGDVVVVDPLMPVWNHGNSVANSAVDNQYSLVLLA
jgi:hypothetical protein